MKKRKWLFVVLTTLLATCLACAFAACNFGPPENPSNSDQTTDNTTDNNTETWTVTFKNGETTVTVDVVKGEAIGEAKIPAAPSAPQGQKFDGWYVGETKVTADYVPTADVTAVAKFSTVTPSVEKWTVTFKNGEDTVKTVEVEKGQAIGAGNMPDDPTNAPQGQKFDGWYVGETKVTADYKPTADVTATAKFVDDTPPAEDTFTVTFVVDEKDGGNFRREVKVTKFGKLTEDQIPDASEFTAPAHSAFDKWVTVDDDFMETEHEFNFNDNIMKDVTLHARFKRTEYVITFKNGDSVVKELLVDASTHKIKDGQTAPTEEDITVPEGMVFKGWFSDYTESWWDEESATDSYFFDETFTAQIGPAVDETDKFKGVWYNEEDHILCYVDQDGRFRYAGSLYDDVALNEDGEMVDVQKISGGENKSTETKFVVTGTTMTVTITTSTLNFAGYPIGDPQTETHVLTKAEASDLAGTYYKDSRNYVTISDGGFVVYDSETSGYVPYYAYFKQTDGGIEVTWYSYETSQYTVTAVKDDKGNLQLGGSSRYGIYVKTESAPTQYSADDPDSSRYVYIYEYTVGSGKLYVYYVQRTSEYTYATFDKPIADGAIVTMTLEGKDQQYVIKVTGSDFVFASAERGTYSGSEGSLVLDGFGGATLNGVSKTYSYADGKVFFDEGGAYSLNLEGQSYTALSPTTAGSHVGTFTCKVSSYTETLELNAYGFVFITEAGFSTYYYSATYTIEGTKLTISGISSSCYYVRNGEYTIEADGNVLVDPSDRIFVKGEYEIVQHLDDFVGTHNGYWKKESGGDGEYIEFAMRDGKIVDGDFVYNGMRATFKANFDSSKLTTDCNIPNGEGGFGKLSVTMRIESGRLHVVGTVNGASYDFYYTSSDKPSLTLESYVGVWTQSDETENPKTIAITVTDGVLSLLVYDDEEQDVDYVFVTADCHIAFGNYVLSFADNVLTVTVSGDGDVVEHYTKTATEVVDRLSEFFGRWEQTDGDYVIEVIESGGSLSRVGFHGPKTGYGGYDRTIYSGSITLNYDGSVMTFEYYDSSNYENYSVTMKLGADGTMTVTIEVDYGVSTITETYSKVDAD